MLYLAQNIYSPRTIIVASSNMTSDKKWWLDPYFLIVLLAACIYWAGLYAMTLPNPNWFWPIQTPAAFLYPALVYPVLEEIVFRGLIQDWFRQKLPGLAVGAISKANLITSLLFTALHFINHPPLWAAAVFIPALIFGYFKDRSGGLGAPIALHVFFNSGYFLIFTHGL